MRSFYGAEYNLAVETAPSDVSRSSAYADLLLARLDAVPLRVMEIGCGSGHTLRALAATWQNTAFVGYEAAPQVAASAKGADPRVTIRNGFVEDLLLPEAGAGFDMVFSINVFEHAADPVAFLAAKAAQLTMGGAIVIICPKSVPPNMELVFQDHIYSFTPEAVAALAERAGLVLIEHDPAPAGLGDFQLFVFSRDGQSAETASAASHDDFATYMAGWSRLDAVLSEALNDITGHAFVFGAGEMAGLLRAYAPATWGAVEACVVDDLAGARALGVPVKKLEEVQPGNCDAVIVATHPRTQKAIARRFGASEATILTFDELIAR
ncbi:class I SAM-dependent methyltransferase [Notoacmeibacter marinus]|uniref:class I SAM-dependent methyltransferase n=1 Tax=Notoacmeibacter marinus TaxID=1876515 RepID=UPI0013033820|nr:class I SAM-dependent methyltransferase [Notoacmeibacter marinus]